MSKIAFIYPGQGAQKVGMGKDFYENSEISKEVYDLADEILDFDIKKVCFEENEYINNTKYTQAALVTTCIAITEAVLNAGIQPDVTAGLSLGEYAAIVTAKGMEAKQAIHAVRKRGIFMDEAVPANDPLKAGAMAAVLGMDSGTVENVLRDEENISIANYNCPGQIVITGLKKDMGSAMDRLKEAGAKRVISLNVSGPFHSKFMKPAGERMSEELEKVRFTQFKIPYVTNVTASYVNDIALTKDLLIEQISSPVKWEQSVRNMIEDGVDTFIEIGPGKTLAGFLRKIDRDVTVYNVATVNDLEELKKNI